MVMASYSPIFAIVLLVSGDIAHCAALYYQCA
jgi:hypothetical protein